MLPLVGSTIVPPGASAPERSAASIIPSAMRSFTEPPGFRYSTFASTSAVGAVDHVVQPHERGVADELEDRVGDLHVRIVGRGGPIGAPRRQGAGRARCSARRASPSSRRTRPRHLRRGRRRRRGRRLDRLKRHRADAGREVVRGPRAARPRAAPSVAIRRRGPGVPTAQGPDLGCLHRDDEVAPRRRPRRSAGALGARSVVTGAPSASERATSVFGETGCPSVACVPAEATSASTPSRARSVRQQVRRGDRARDVGVADHDEAHRAHRRSWRRSEMSANQPAIGGR